MTPPDETTTSAELRAIRDLTQEIIGLRHDVRDERRGRRLSIVVMAIAVTLGGVFVNAERVDRANDANAACDTRIEARAEIRKAITTAVNVVAIYAEVPEDDRDRLVAQVTAAVLEELPPPDC